MAAHISVPDRYSIQEKRRAYKDFWIEMMPYLANAVDDSLVSHPLRRQTRTAMAERVDFATKLVNGLRQEFKWSKWRIRDHIGVILRARLSGIHLPIERMARRGAW